jgi:Flp pilus assembly protein CpaB
MIVLQHNCNGTAVSMLAALEAAIERGAEVACLQEPHVGRKYTISHPSSQIRWPECANQDTRVALAIRNDALDRYVFEE